MAVSLMAAASILDKAKPTAPITSSAAARSNSITDFKSGNFITGSSSPLSMTMIAAIAGILLIISMWKK